MHGKQTSPRASPHLTRLWLYLLWLSLLWLYLLWLYLLWLSLLWLSLAGSLALPSLSKLASVLGGAPRAAWHRGAHLPIEISLPAELRFHSVATRPANHHPNPQS
jgi:hypothetical protein